jgi:hypothetical protein
MEISADTYVQASPDHVSCDLEGEAALLNLKTGVYYGLNHVGALVWKDLQQPIQISDVCDHLITAYPQPQREQIITDVFELLIELIDAGLVTVQPAPPAAD